MTNDSYNRRNALRVMGVTGAGLFLVACGKDKKSDATAASASASADATAVPTETGGPFPGDGSNGPNVLNQSGVVRSDIRSSFGSMSGTAEGVPLTVKLRVINTKTKAPYAGAAIYLWHCDATGGYSLYSQGVTNRNYFRGVQAADANGLLTFTSVYPAAYSGRWPHMHYEVFSSLEAAAEGSPKLVTSQIALPEDTSNDVYKSDSLYSASVQNMKQTSLRSDNVFSDGAELETPTMSGDIATGLTMTFTVGV